MIRTVQDEMQLRRAMRDDHSISQRLLRLVGLTVPLTEQQEAELGFLFVSELWTVRAERGDFSPPAPRGAGAVVPGRCRWCGCTDANACRLPDGSTCAWMDRDHTTCSATACMCQEQDRIVGAVEAKR